MQLRNFRGCIFLLHTASVARSLKYHLVFVTVFREFRIYRVANMQKFMCKERTLTERLVTRQPAAIFIFTIFGVHLLWRRETLAGYNRELVSPLAQTGNTAILVTRDKS